MQNDSNNEADPPRQNAGSIYLSALYEPNVASWDQKQAGLAMLRPPNDTHRKRLVAVSAPIGGQSRDLGCANVTLMSFYGTPVVPVFMERDLSLHRGNQTMIRPQVGGQYSVDVNTQIGEW